MSIQHGLLLGVTKCYSKLSNDALNVLSGVLNLDLRAKIERNFETFTLWGETVDDTDFRPDSVEMWKDPPRRDELWRIP